MVTPLGLLCYDVVIVGGGPAGSATALSLRTHAPSLAVAIVDAGAREGIHIGETLPPAAAQLLDHLELTEAFTDQCHLVTHGTAAAWGSDSLVDNDFLYGARGPGWHLDRLAFDKMLLRESERRGITVLRDTRVRALTRGDECWSVTTASGQRITARFVVDATGTSASIARQLGAHRIAEDRLAGFTCFFDDNNSDDQRTLVEAFSDGWWYTAALPTKRRVVACMTDVDIGRRLALSSCNKLTRQLAYTRHIAQTVQHGRLQERVIMRSAQSHRLDRCAGNGWLAVGDAAAAVDPLSSQGMCRALRSGIFASYAVGDLLNRGVRDAATRYDTFVQREFMAYMQVRGKFYREAQRWPASEFWRRRHTTIT